MDLKIAAVLFGLGTVCIVHGMLFLVWFFLQGSFLWPICLVAIFMGCIFILIGALLERDVKKNGSLLLVNDDAESVESSEM